MSIKYDNEQNRFNDAIYWQNKGEYYHGYAMVVGQMNINYNYWMAQSAKAYKLARMIMGIE